MTLTPILWSPVFVSTPVSIDVSEEDILEQITLSTGVTASVTVTPSGGSGIYTYSWEQVGEEYGGAELGVITADNPTSATTDFNYVFYGANRTYYVAYYKCTVTDELGQSSFIIISVMLIAHADLEISG